MFLRRDLSGFPPQEHLLYCVEQDVSAPLELPAGAWAAFDPQGKPQLAITGVKLAGRSPRRRVTWADGAAVDLPI